MERKLLIILNPRAGLRHAPRALCDILAIFQNAGYVCTVCLTNKSGDGIELAQQYGGGVDRIVAIGGDGTLNEVVSGMRLGGHHIPVGYIPAGSTNDFAAGLGLSNNLLTAAKDAANGHPQNIDIGQFNQRIFTYVASFGAFTRASYATPQNVKNTLGHLAYILEGIKDIPNIRSTHMCFEIDDQTLEGDYIFGAISNSTSLGGLLKLDPNRVDMNDGLLELLLIRLPNNAAEFTQILSALNSRQYESSNCIFFCSAHRILVRPDPSIDWTLDGERAEGCEKIEILNIPSAVQIILPEKKN